MSSKLKEPVAVYFLRQATVKDGKTSAIQPTVLFVDESGVVPQMFQLRKVLGYSKLAPVGQKIENLAKAVTAHEMRRSHGILRSNAEEVRLIQITLADAFTLAQLAAETPVLRASGGDSRGLFNYCVKWATAHGMQFQPADAAAVSPVRLAAVRRHFLGEEAKQDITVFQLSHEGGVIRRILRVLKGAGFRQFKGYKTGMALDYHPRILDDLAEMAVLNVTFRAHATANEAFEVIELPDEFTSVAALFALAQQYAYEPLLTYIFEICWSNSIQLEMVPCK